MKVRARQLYRLLPLSCVAALVLVPLIFALQLDRVGPQPHDVEIGVSGPALVAQAVAERADALPGRPFDAIVLREGDDPAAPVRDGLLAAAVTIDFRQDRDVLHVSSRTDPDLVAEVLVRLDAISSTYGRSLQVVTVAPPRSEAAWRGTPYAMVAAWIVLGIVLSVVLTWARGPMTATGHEVARRWGLTTGTSALGGVAVALVAGSRTDAGLLAPSAVGALAIAGTAWLVLGAEALFGLVGLGFAIALEVGALAPLVALSDTWALPPPWPDVLPWTAPGAALALAESEVYGTTTTGPAPWSVLVSWALLALLTLALARRERARGADGSRPWIRPRPRPGSSAP